MTAATVSGPVPLTRALAAELVRTRHSASTRFVWVGLVVALLQGLAWWGVATAPMRDWLGVLGWQSIYATALLAPIVALLAATTVSREAAAREGGTWARPLAPGRAVAARLIVLAGQSLLLHAAITLPMVVFGLGGGLTDPPIGRFVAMWLVMWATALLPLALGFVLTRRIGMIATVVLAFVWQIAGTVLAESPSWWAQPWTWGVHAIQPVLGIHHNGVRLEADAPMWSWNPWWPVLLSAVAALLVMGITVARASLVTRPRRVGPASLRRRTHPVEEDAPLPVRTGLSAVGKVTRGRPRHVAAHAIVLRGTAVPALVGVSTVVLVLIAAVWPSTYVMGFATWLLVPMGSVVLAALAWGAHEQGWRVAALRAPMRDLAGSLFGVCVAILVLIVAAVTILGVVASGPAVPPWFPVLLFCVGLMVLTIGLWLSTRFGTGMAIGVVLGLLVVSLVFGGSGLAETPLWVIGVLGWPVTAATPGRALVTALIALLVSAGAITAWFSALRRAAR